MMENKRDLSISMARANVIVMFVSIPVAILQFAIFGMVHGREKMETTWVLYCCLCCNTSWRSGA